MHKKTPLIAAIDLGTNSFHMVTASVNNRQMLKIVSREKEMVRLGSSGGDMKKLMPDAIERGVRTLKHFAEIAKNDNADIRAIATSAVREAQNQSDFIERVKNEIGIDIEVVSGVEEGRLIYIGAMHAVPIFDKKALVIDIGGGSTEAIIGLKGNINFVNSHKLGAIRLTKKFFHDGISTPKRVSESRDFIKGDWAPTLKLVEQTGFEVVVGTSGTITNLALMTLAMRGEKIPGIINGLTVSGADILKVINLIVNTRTVKERAALPGMDADRADIITAGALILEQAIKQLHIDKLILSSYALREGIVFDTVLKSRSESEHRVLSHLRYDTIYHLCQIYQVDIEHAEHIKQLALQIFDGLQDLHKLGFSQREFLEDAAMLHDAGYHISHDSHHKHSYYLIKNSIMPGFTMDESEYIANIARYHRKSHPKKKHENFKGLSNEKQDGVRILSGILRISEGIDRRMLKNVLSVGIKYDAQKITISLISEHEKAYPDIELWGAERRKLLLEETLCRNIVFEIV
ncbi:MAG: exopolyphosphatase [Ignavibacteria bacterium]|nr:exopolyphosphatase [Ignavibacteria bacterium]